MPYTDAQISNMALGHIGVQGYIADLSTDRTNEGRACRSYFSHSRDVILEMMPWPFATVRADLQIATGVAFDGWTFAYTYPNDCALAVSIVQPSMRTPDQNSRVKFKIVKHPTQAGKIILTDQENAVLEYNMRVSDPAEFDASFAHAQSLLLSTMVVGPLKVSADIAQKVQREWAAWQSEASGKALRERADDLPAEAELVSVRS